jgi:hypothetical protein
MRRAQCSARAGGLCGRKASGARGRNGFCKTSGANVCVKTFTTTGMNLTGWPCGAGAVGAGFAGFCIGAMPHSQTGPEQQPSVQGADLASLLCTHEGLETDAPATCTIRKMAARMSLLQRCFMFVRMMMFGCLICNGQFAALPETYFFSAAFTLATNLAGSLLKSLVQDLQHRYTSVPSWVTLTALPMVPRSSSETTHFLSG